MKNAIIKLITIMLLLGMWASSLNTPSTQAADLNCNNMKDGSKIYWKGSELKPRQIGIAYALSKTPIYKLEENKKVISRYANKGEKLRVYRITKTTASVGTDTNVIINSKIKIEKLPSNLIEKTKCAALYEKKLKENASQMLVVKASSKTKNKATLQAYEKKNGKWVKVGKSVSALIGKEGIGKTKEGDGKTPKGTFLLGTSFGWGKKPSIPSYPFRQATKYDYWVDDAKSKDYNKWITYKGDAKKKWNSFERLTHPLYKYAVVIRYNDSPIVKGEGSAIFLHIKKDTTRYTLGCVAINEKDILKIIKWLDQKKQPIIINE